MCGVLLIYPVATNLTMAYCVLQTHDHKHASSTVYHKMCLFLLVWVEALSNLKPGSSIYVKFC